MRYNAPSSPARLGSVCLFTIEASRSATRIGFDPRRRDSYRPAFLRLPFIGIHTPAFRRYDVHTLRCTVALLQIINVFVFSEREISSPVCRLSVCNVRAPYCEDWNIRQYFYAVWYLSCPLTTRQNFHGNRPSEPLRRGRVNARGEPNIAIMDLSKAISRKRRKIWCKLLLITNRKSHMSFRLVPKSVTLDDLERHNSHHIALFYRIRQLLGFIT